MKKIFSHILEDGWNIAVRQNGTGSILKDRTTPFQIIPNTWRAWAADPFIIESDGITYIFAELFDYIERKGNIGYTSLKNGKWTKWKIVLKEPFHLSYPNVFRLNDDIYMVPESSGGHTLNLYKATEFPKKWKLEKIIEQDVEWVDTTFFQQNDELYAITTDISNEERHADYLLGFDRELNLISKTEIKELHTALSREAGNIFEIEGKRVRVSQKCLSHYGEALIFSDFNSIGLSEKGLQNQFLQLYPDNIITTEKYKWTGIHTYNSLENYEVIDVERKHFNILGIASRLLLKIR